MIWRRFLIRSDSTLTDLHNTLQIAFGWCDFHLHRFRGSATSMKPAPVSRVIKTHLS
ncbi:MAG: plasmid pRiA4b ORF-3 family protein [Acidobacteria bacterium]|nr:plasmid pRiA4b ORF-3 family protein [Acidobacteriota bacterium]